jgi:DNA-binding winged helix-turn-helix (wHTH) protein/TolB-like protein
MPAISREAVIYTFEGFTFDAGRRRLADAKGDPVRLVPKALDALVILLENAGSVISKDQLMARIWPDTVVEENNLNQCISALRKSLGETRGDHKFIVTVPGRGYEFVAPVTRHRSDLQNEIVGSEMHSTASQLPPADHSDIRDHRHLFVAALMFIFVALVATLAGWQKKGAAQKERTRSLAVLPFKPLIAEERNEALEFGMTESLISKLGKSDKLVVRQFNSVRGLDSPRLDPLDAGRKLGVDLVLDGTIRRDGDRLRVSAVLLNVADGTQLWMQNFDQNFTGILEVQDAISDRVAAVLHTKLNARRNPGGTTHPEAYGRYLLGRYFAFRLTPEDHKRALKYFEEAIALDPNYAMPFVGIAMVHRTNVLANDAPPHLLLPRVREAALRALEIDPKLPDAELVLGTLAFLYDWDWAATEKHLQKVNDLDPDTTDLAFFKAHFDSNMGRHESAVEYGRQARELEPLNLVRNALEGQFLFYAGRYDESISRLKHSIELDPFHWLPRMFIARAYIEKGMYAEAIDEAEKARELGTVNLETIALIGYAHAKLGNVAQAHRAIDELKAIGTNRYVPPYFIAIVHAGLGKSDTVLDLLEHSYEIKDIRMTWLKVEPKWDDLRDEPRFVALMQKMNFD